VIVRHEDAQSAAHERPLPPYTRAGKAGADFHLIVLRYSTPPDLVVRPIVVDSHGGLNGSVGQTRADAARVLIIDDDPGAVESFARMLGLVGYRVFTASDALSGLLELQRASPDVILLDLRMPTVDGLEFLRRLRAQAIYSATPVAIITGVPLLDESVMAELQELGAEVRFKPLWMEELIVLVQRLLRK
jgi:CheY-like chemotaxis protein